MTYIHDNILVHIHDNYCMFENRKLNRFLRNHIFPSLKSCNFESCKYFQKVKNKFWTFKT